MNWRLGIFRAWAIVSAIWVAGLLGILIWSLSAYPDQHISTVNWAQYLLVMFGGPIALLFLGRGVIWVVEGFRSTER